MNIVNCCMIRDFATSRPDGRWQVHIAATCKVVHSLTGVEARALFDGGTEGLADCHHDCPCARRAIGRFDGWAPVLLLDEIAAHLDAERRAGLFEEIDALGIAGLDDRYRSIAV